MAELQCSKKERIDLLEFINHYVLYFIENDPTSTKHANWLYQLLLLNNLSKPSSFVLQGEPSGLMCEFMLWYIIQFEPCDKLHDYALCNGTVCDCSYVILLHQE